MDGMHAAPVADLVPVSARAVLGRAKVHLARALACLPPGHDREEVAAAKVLVDMVWEADLNRRCGFGA